MFVSCTSVSGFVLSKCLQPSFVVSNLLSWHVRAMEQVCQYLHYQPPLRTLVLLMVLFLDRIPMTLPFLIRQSHVFLLYLLLLTIRIACMTISTRRPTIKNWSSRFTLIFPPSFCLNLPVLSQHKENKSGGREHEEIMTSLHQRVSCGLSVSHTQVSQSQETHYCCQALPNIISRRFLFGWFWSINSDFRSCRKKKPTKGLFFRPWWPSHHWLRSFILMTCLFSASPWQDLKTKKKRSRNRE